MKYKNMESLSLVDIWFSGDYVQSIKINNQYHPIKDQVMMTEKYSFYCIDFDLLLIIACSF